MDMLKVRGVKRIFGIPGGGSSLALMEAAGRAGIDFILTRTETAAAIMASVTGELTGTPGVLLTGIGPGAASAVNGIAYAYLEKSPVILITDGPASSPHQALDQNALYKPVTKLQGQLKPESGARDFANAILTAMTPPWGPVHLDLTAGDASAPVSAPTNMPVAAAPPAPDPESLEKARALVANSQKPIILTGLEARQGDAPLALRFLANALACPVLTTFKASGVIPANHPGFAGLFTGAMAESEIIHSADLIVAFGLDPIEIIPGRWPYESPVLDISAADATPPPYPPACRVTGNIPALAEALAPALKPSAWTIKEIEQARRGIAEKFALEGKGHTAQTVIEAAADLAPPGTRLTMDAGAHMFAALAFWPASEPFGALKSNGLSTMGYALPAAIASSLEEPDRHVLAVTGDGGLMMCLGELATAVEHGCNITVIVINDATLSLIDIKQQRQQYESCGVRTTEINIAACADALGCRAWRVEPDADIAPVLSKAFAGKGPALIDVVVGAEGYGDQLTRIRG
jgi:acetolactate synthase-1/2/3 large subunit